MSKRIPTLILLNTILIVFFSNCNSNQQTERTTKIENASKTTKIDNPLCQPKTHSHSDMIEYHKTNCFSPRWPLKHEFDLNNDGLNEVMLLLDEGSRSGRYILYTYKGGTWEIISDKNFVFANHIDPEVDMTSTTKWKDFKTFESHNEFTYTWNGKSYVQK